MKNLYKKLRFQRETPRMVKNMPSRNDIIIAKNPILFIPFESNDSFMTIG